MASQKEWKDLYYICFAIKKLDGYNLFEGQYCNIFKI